MIRVEAVASDETQIVVTDYSEEDKAEYALFGEERMFTGGEIDIHPWIRQGGRDRQVSIRTKMVDFKGEVFPNDKHLDYSFMTIVDRDEFIDALLKAFPTELKDARK